jgi:phosphoribosylanthranilate isomerase
LGGDTGSRIVPERAAELFAAAGDTVRRVGVFGADEPREVARVAGIAAVHVVQLHGDPDAEYVRRVRAECGAEIWAVVRVANGSTGARIAELDSEADAIVLDALVPGRLGGTGTSFDWRLAATWTRPRHARLVVAGGLGEHNVGEAIRLLDPQVVDVSSGVESAPGIKDHERMQAFADAIRRHYAQL